MGLLKCFDRLKLPKLRGQPKLHKLSEPLYMENLTFRPILSGKGGPLSGLSELLDKVLRPIADIMPCRIKDSFDALEKIKENNFDKYVLHTFDASSLYTSFDVNLAIRASKYWLSHENSLLIPERFHGDFIPDSIRILFTQNYFSFNDKIYLQKNGLAMGTECAVVLAEIILGYLETTNDLNPPTWWRYIDDGLCRIPKNNKNECQVEVLNKLNSMDRDIKWTSDPIGPLTPFLDLEISETGTVKTYHKPSSGWACFVPWKSSHPFHMKCNIAFNLFFRAARINSDEINLISECNRIELSLLSLGYPLRVIRNQKSKALNHSTIGTTISSSFLDQKKTIYFTTTRSNISTGKKFCDLFKAATKILKFSVIFSPDKVEIKRSFRQPPNLATRLMWKSLEQKNMNSVPCNHNSCKICKCLYLQKTWTSNNGITLKVARATCGSKNIIYILVDRKTNDTLYVGQTCQKLNLRLKQQRLKNSWFKTDSYFIVPIQGAPEGVKKIEHESILIQKLNPLRNKQKDFYWWNAKSNYKNYNTS